MNYYKIIKDNTLIGVATSYDMRKFQQKHRVFLICDEDDAQYIQFNRALYHDNWMAEPLSDSFEYAQIKVIDKNEYDVLFHAVETNEKVIIPAEFEQEPELDSISEDDSVELEFVRNAKLNEIKYECNKSITNGITIQSNHYSYNLEDQSNLNELYITNNGGLYHADGEAFRYYSAEEIKEIYISQRINQMDNQIYYNNLKSYIFTLNNINEISSIKYGQELQEPFFSNYKQLMNEVYRMYKEG